jgi:hypothetical protein
MAINIAGQRFGRLVAQREKGRTPAQKCQSIAAKFHITGGLVSAIAKGRVWREAA